MKESFSKIVLAVNLVIVLLLPNLAFAAPLPGADSDLTIFWYQMGMYNDDTTDAYDSDSSGDVSWPAGNQDSKSSYIGHTSKFGTVVVDVSGATSDTDQNLNMEYYSGPDTGNLGQGWSLLTLTAQTHPFDSTGINSFSFTPPEDWTLKTLNGVEAYYIRTATSFGNITNERGFVNAQVSQISVLLAAGGGGGAATPEFTDLLYITTLLAGGWYVYTKISKKEQSGLAI